MCRLRCLHRLEKTKIPLLLMRPGCLQSLQAPLLPPHHMITHARLDKLHVVPTVHAQHTPNNAGTNKRVLETCVDSHCGMDDHKPFVLPCLDHST